MHVGVLFLFSLVKNANLQLQFVAINFAIKQSLSCISEIELNLYSQMVT
jgi:hypothetical protein